MRKFSTSFNYNLHGEESTNTNHQNSKVNHNVNNENFKFASMSLNEINASKSFSDIEVKIQKKLDFLNLSEDGEVNKRHSRVLKSIQVNNPPDETQEVLQELMVAEATLRQSENTFLKTTKCEKINTCTGQKSSNRENAQSEASTQTSFLVEVKENRLADVNKLDIIKKKKLKHMIEFQRHEKRFKELELLAKLERLQAERIKKLYIECNGNGSSLLATDASYDQTQLSADYSSALRRKSEIQKFSTNQSDDLTLVSQIDSLIYNLNEQKSSKHCKQPTTGEVQVVNLNNTSIHKPLKGVLVVKENEPTRRVGQLANNHSVCFQIEPPPPPPSCSSSNAKTDLSKLSLQEAFELFKKDLIMRSQKRQMKIEERARKREQLARRTEIELKLKEEKLLSKMKLATARNNNQANRPKRRLSNQEIREITRKNYEKLTEVKEKQSREKLELSKKINRTKAYIYKKVTILSICLLCSKP